MQEPATLAVTFSQSIPLGPPMAPMLVVGESKEADTLGVKPSPVQTILAESALDAISEFSAQPSNPSETDLLPLVSQTVAVLSSMAMELGVIFRVRIRIDHPQLCLDAEKIRRSLNVLLVHLLTVSNPQAFVTIQLEPRTLDNLPGFAISLSSNQTVVTKEFGPDSAGFWDARPELSISRRMIEQQRGRLFTERTEDGKLTYHLWLPA
jgi:hypothetical protein